MKETQLLIESFEVSATTESEGRVTITMNSYNMAEGSYTVDLYDKDCLTWLIKALKQARELAFN